MQNARYETIHAKIDAGSYRFTSSASKLVFDGFMAVYMDNEKVENNAAVRKLTKDSILKPESFEPKQHFTQPPAHYTEASLCKGAGRIGNWPSFHICAHDYYYFGKGMLL